MAARHVAALIQRLHPNVAVRHLETVAGLPVNAMANYVKPGRELKRIPPARIIRQFAHALGCDANEVVRAFAADVDLPWNGPPLSEEDESDLRMLQTMHVEDRATLRLFAQTLSVARGRR